MDKSEIEKEIREYRQEISLIYREWWDGKLAFNDRADYYYLKMKVNDLEWYLEIGEEPPEDIGTLAMLTNFLYD